MLKTQSCQACSRRKVRCDHGEPCSNCKRRKDDCVYAESHVSSAERIKELEALVRSLRGGAEDTISTDTVATNAVSQPPRDVATSEKEGGTNPVMLDEDGETIYVESSSWYSWNDSAKQGNDTTIRTLLTPSTGSGALQSVICRDRNIDLPTRHPSAQDAAILWDAFLQRVHPTWKVMFNQELVQMRNTVTGYDGYAGITFSDHAFLFAMYLISVTALSDEECLELLGQSKQSMLMEHRLLCEQALAGSDLLGSSELRVIQAAMLYIWSGLLTEMNPRSLWGLMGIIMRNAERSGLHRDGTVFGLSPYETEKRRRIWWSLQHLDIALAVRSGSMSLTLNARWDTKLPLNIEDEDISPDMRKPPPERERLTSMSHCLWTLWVVQEQRSFRHADGTYLGFSWAAEKSLSRADKTALVDRLEAGLSKHYFQYCDPIRPLDVLIQIRGRAFICGMRRLVLQTLVQNSKLSEVPEADRKELLDVCMQALEYDAALQTTPLIAHFRVLFRDYFQWNALAFVLVEARRLFDKPITARIWSLLENVYKSNVGLSEYLGDRRKSYAIELAGAAWRAREAYLMQQNQHNQYNTVRKPAFLVELEAKLHQFSGGTGSLASNKRQLDGEEYTGPGSAKRRHPEDAASAEDVPSHGLDFSQYEMGIAGDLDFDFDSFDWSFWNTVQ